MSLNTQDSRIRNRMQQRRPEDDDPVDVNDIQVENQVDYDDEDDRDNQDVYGVTTPNQGYGRSNPQSYSGVSGIGAPNSAGISGKANRIGAYRKSNNFGDNLLDGERSTERRRRTQIVGKSPQTITDDLDDSFNGDGLGNPDIKMAVQNLQETQQVVNVIDKVENNFSKAKKKINGLDLVTLESDITAQTLTTCYQVINGSLVTDKPNFDGEKMNTRLDQMQQRVKTGNSEYNKFKGEFFAVNEPIINKDTLTLNLDRAERYLEKQEIVLSKLPSQEELVKENHSQIVVLKKKYQAFEGQLFSIQVDETRQVIKDTEDLIEKIEVQEENLKNLVDQATNNFSKVQPQTKEQRQKFQKIQQDLNQIEQKIDDSIYDLNQELKNKEDLDNRHEESEKILGQIGPVDITQMVSQSREMKKLVETHKKWVDLYKRLKQLQDEEINNLEFFIQKAIQNAKKFQESVNSEKKDEYDDIMKKLQKLAKKVVDDAEEQSIRLDQFENKVVKPHTLNPHIADTDMIFLKKEISRNKAALEVVKNMAHDVLEDAQAVNDDNQRGLERSVSINELQQLKENLKALQKIDQVDNPRIKRNIDMLEGFSVKSLKNQLNDDNKKSQAMISQMKKNFEDLQRQIEKLNGKVVTSSQQIVNLKNNFGNDDQERENEFVRSLDDKLEQCNKDINGDRSDSVRGELSERSPDLKSDKQKSLQARKRAIIAQINKMVNQFNENNKLIKEANKVAKNEKEMSDLISRNKEIQDDCNKIADSIEQGKIFAVDINDRLDSLMDPNLANLRDKYNNKNAAIDECDEVFDQASAQIANQEAAIAEELEKMKQIIARLDTVNPVNNPTVPGQDNSKFFKEMGPKLDQAYKLQDQLEAMKDDLAKAHNNLINIVEPLNELGEREVKKPEIDDILNKLNNIGRDLNQADKDIIPKKQDIKALMDEVDNMLERDKGRKVDEADQLLGDLDDQIDDLEKKRDDLFKKLSDYKNLIADAKGREGREDPELLAKLRDLDAEAKALEREIIDNDNKMNDLKKKRNDSKRLLDEIKRQPNKFTPSQIDQLLQNLGENNEKQIGLNDKADQQEDDIDQKLEDLNALLDSSQRRKQLQNEIDGLTKQMQDDMDSFLGVLDKTPKQIDQLLKTLGEMKIGSEPDESADYWEERKTIDQQIAALKKVKQKLDQLQKIQQKKKAEFDQILASGKKSFEIKDLENQARDLKQASGDLQDQVNSAFDCRDEVNDIKKDMADCDIPVNIQVRRNELQAYLERLDRIKADFKDLKQADEDFEGDSTSEKDIRALIRQIEQQVRSYDQEGRDMQKYQNQKLDMYREQDFMSYNVYLIIIEVREFKLRVFNSTMKLKDLEDLINELNTKLIQQDMDNATVLLTKKASKLRERLLAAQNGLRKIHNCGNEMDGNTTHNEEDEFIDALKDEMPDVFKNIDLNFEQIDGIDILLKQVIETRNIEKMALLKKEIDDANNKVEQSEGLVVKLENEIVEWNAFKKLCRRDEELAEIDALLKDFSDDLQEELQLMDKELQKNNQKMEKDGDPKGQLTQQRNGLINYMDEIEELMKFIIQLKDEKDLCFKEFNDDLPRMVKEARLKRQQISSGMGSPNGRKPGSKSNIGRGIDLTATDSDKPNDIYYMITINCRYRKRIHELLKELRNINQRRRELEDKYASLKRDLSAIKATKAYKPVKGDPIDELFAYHLNKCGCTLQVKRLAPGKYLFGTRQILAKIINGKLVIRVGGGYMSAEEFIEQYGRQEMMKMMKDQENKSQDGLSGRAGAYAGQGKMDGKPAVGMGDMREMMRNQLMNVKLYENQGSADNLIGSTNRRSNVKGNQKVSLNELEGTYKMATISKAGMSPAPQRNKMDIGMGSPKRDRVNINRTTSNDNFQRVSSPNIKR